MVIVDNALRARQEQGKPIRVAILGAGFMSQGLTNQIVHSVPGMRMVALFSRQVKKGFHIYNYAGFSDIVIATTQDQLEDAIRAGKPVVTSLQLPALGWGPTQLVELIQYSTQGATTRRTTMRAMALFG